MSRMDGLRKLGVISAIVALAACGSDSGEQLTITKGQNIAIGFVNDQPGFSYGTVNPAGIDADLMHFIGAKLKLPVAPTPLVHRDRGQALKDGRATIVIATYSITKSRNDEGIDFAGPYMVSSQALLVQADSPIKDRSHLKDKNICTVAGTTGADALIREVGKQGPQKDTQTECIKLVADGDADGFFTDTLILYGYAQKQPNLFKVVLPGVYGQKQFYGVGLLGGKNADCLRLNEVITEFVRDKWRGHFQTALPGAVEAFKAGDPNTGDFESEFKPRDGDMTALSCQV